MKIKSVKITGFRAFEKEVDSTFDFTKEGEIVNFASIYAPNGFGKTSFYDAVEWGVTNKIQRFDRMVDFEKIRKDNDSPLLLNKSSSFGKVTIETDTENFENVINKKKVYKYNEKPINEYFQNQILTQDLIDAFLKDEKADKRYENFLEIDDNLKKYDLAYKKIIRLLEFIKDERKELVIVKEEMEGKFQFEFDFEQEFKKFDEINEIISSLNEENENLKLINQNSFDQTIYDNLLRYVNVRSISLEDNLAKVRQKINEIIFARDGDESEYSKISGGVFSYFENREKILKIDVLLNELRQINNWYVELETIKNESNLNNVNLLKEQKRLERALNIENKFKTFLAIQEEVDSLQKNITENKDLLIQLENAKLKFENDKNDSIRKINELNISLENKQQFLNSLPDLQKQFKSTVQIIDDSQQELASLSKSIEIEEKKWNEIKAILVEFDYYENLINSNIELLLEFKMFSQFKELVVSYLNEKNNITNLKRDVSEILIKIENQNNFNKELNEFINSGLELTNKSKSSNCPLCNYNYITFEKLIENILSNKLLDNQLKIYLADKLELDNKINKLELQLSLEKEQIEHAFSFIKQPFSQNLNDVQNDIARLNSEKKLIFDKLGNNQSILNNIKLSFGESKTFDELMIKTQNDLLIIENQIVENSNQLNRFNDASIENKGVITSIKEKLEVSERALLKFNSSIDYIEIKEYFLKELDTFSIEKTILTKHIFNIKESINDFINKKETQNKSIEELNEKLSSYTNSKEYYINKSQELNENKNLILRVYQNYENFIQSEFNLNISDKNKSQTEKAFSDLIEAEKQVEKQVETKIGKYKVIRILNDACIKATESKKAQDLIVEITNKIKELGLAEKLLIAEKNNLRSYLKDSIEAFFYTNLINAIYKKIDPHPDYKEVKFECDFAESKPRLQIYTLSVDDKKEEIWNVPTLYFSTAQVNILSLSIFLARALKTKNPKTNEPINCIFIDDPIQSMDSINIVSIRPTTYFLSVFHSVNS